MRSPRNSLIADLRRTAETARETAASALYGLEPLRLAMTKAAGAGFEHVTVDGPDGLDLRDTPAARAAVAWLIETRLTHRWDPRPGATGADRAGGWNLVVSWRPEVSAIG